MTTLHHTADGRADAPALILGPSLGTSLRLWQAQVPALARGRRVVRYDLPGHGGSPASLLREPTVAGLGALVLDLADSLGIARFAYAGVSLGAAVGIWLAAHHPERVESLAAVSSSARFGEPAGWRDRAARVREEGVGPLAGTAAARWFTPAFAATDTARALVADHRAADPEAYAACCDALAALDLGGDLVRVAAPTLVVSGRQDVATPPAHGRELADGIGGSDLVEIDGAAHLAPAEQPGRVLHALLGHFEDAEHVEHVGYSGHLGHSEHVGRFGHVGPRPLGDGSAVRRAVLGDAHVDRATAGTTAFTAPFQDLITRYAWGEIWTRPGLDRRTRSCVTLTALVAGGHHDELALHVRAARRNGLSPQEIQEVLLQCAVYCGVPAANTAFAIADRVLGEQEELEELEEEASS